MRLICLVGAALVSLCACGTRTGLHGLGAGANANGEPNGVAGSGGSSNSGSSAGLGGGQSGQSGDGGVGGSGVAGAGGSTAGPRKWSQVSAGGSHMCALTTLGEVYCLGFGAQGQLGDGQDKSYSLELTRVINLPFIVSIDAGGGHSCAISSDSNVYCWGNSEYGQVGDGQKGTGHHVSSPVLVPLPDKAVQVAAGGYQFGGGHTCVLMQNKKVACWGYNAGGQIGNGESGFGNSVLTPFVVPSADLTSIAAGGAHSCATGADYYSYCWGQNYAGQTDPPNVGVTTVTVVPSVVYGGAFSSNARAGDDVTCVVALGIGLYCWGEGGFGQFGLEPGGPIFSPSPSFYPYNAIAADMGATHGCVIDMNQLIACAGLDSSGEVGSGDPGPFSIVIPAVEVPIEGIPTQISTGTHKTCALNDEGRIFCWGDFWGSTPTEVLIPE